ncbi:MAG: AbrB/MazE/SpoVT family DNA-binding domain-containing protein [Kiritimatiellia bacterium]
MNLVKVSPKFQVVIPKAVRSKLSISSGDRLQVIPINGRIELIPLHTAAEVRGIAKGIDTGVERQKSDRI